MKEIESELLLRFLEQRCTKDDFKKIEEYISHDERHARYIFEMERLWSLKHNIKYSSEEEIKEACASSWREITAGKNAKSCMKDKSRVLVRWTIYAASVIVAGVFIFLSLSRVFPEDTVALNKIETPTGERVCITLSDGTVVWLNSQSTISYPSDFSGKERRVFIEGEGYFEVAPDKKKPFFVESESLTVRVLGTRFNFKAYRAETACVSLHEGELEAYSDNGQERLLMYANDEVEYSHKTGLRKMERENITHTSTWISGELHFSESKLSDIVRVLNRKYANNIFVQDEALKSELFSCRIHPEASLIDVADILRETRKMDYYIDESGIIHIIKAQ